MSFLPATGCWTEGLFVIASYLGKAEEAAIRDLI